ncbi:hypothetical protein FRB95_004174 [Tulasnella sp. JGI-2019a]|nr:hypothetical protein FRB95_004174 [Tulasnella sp. JGI-2019a]
MHTDHIPQLAFQSKGMEDDEMDEEDSQPVDEQMEALNLMYKHLSEAIEILESMDKDGIYIWPLGIQNIITRFAEVIKTPATTTNMTTPIMNTMSTMPPDTTIAKLTDMVNSQQMTIACLIEATHKTQEAANAPNNYASRVEKMLENASNTRPPAPNLTGPKVSITLSALIKPTPKPKPNSPNQQNPMTNTLNPHSHNSAQ